MSFNYSVINLKVIDDLRIICERPSTKWSEEEALKVALVIETLRIVLKQRELPLDEKEETE